VNTSFNVRGEPIVCTPSDAYRCFLQTDMDVLVIDNFLLLKEAQTANNIPPSNREVFAPD
jgi:carbamoyltransferase